MLTNAPDSSGFSTDGNTTDETGQPSVRCTHEIGHFYSPITNPAELEPQTARLWPDKPEILGIDFNERGHRRILRKVFPRFVRDYRYPERLQETPDLTRFYTQNSQFSWLDPRALFVLLRHWCPRRMIEVGSGFSTLLTADVNRRFFGCRMDFACVEPYPRPFLRNALPGVTRLVEEKVQDVPLADFSRLRSGDVLFIDSSHVAKTGSDVNFLFFEVMPRLARGVRIHIHDIFLPHEYPRTGSSIRTAAGTNSTCCARS